MSNQDSDLLNKIFSNLENLKNKLEKNSEEDKKLKEKLEENAKRDKELTERVNNLEKSIKKLEKNKSTSTSTSLGLFSRGKNKNKYDEEEIIRIARKNNTYVLPLKIINAGIKKKLSTEKEIDNIYNTHKNADIDENNFTAIIDIFNTLFYYNGTLENRIKLLELKEELRFKVYANSEDPTLKKVKKAFDEELSKLSKLSKLNEG